MIDIKALYKNYGEREILKAINVQIPTEMLTCLIGPNAAGKSTLLSCIAGLEKCDSGKISLDGQDIKRFNLQAFSKKISFLKQQNHMDLKLTVYEIIAFGRFPYSQGQLNREDHTLIEETMEHMDLCSLRDQFIDQLSGGERQRVFLAMIIVQDTEYILFDEPLNNLDMKHAVNIMQIAESLVRDFKKTVIMVVHDINFAANYADFIIGMKAGEVIFQDHKDEIIQANKLKQLFDIDFHLMRIGEQTICNYYKLPSSTIINS